MKWIKAIKRLRWTLANVRQYAARLNRAVDVEQELLNCAAGRRQPPTPAECREWALKLGVPECYRKTNTSKS